MLGLYTSNYLSFDVQVILRTSSTSINVLVNKVQEFLLVAEAVLNVEEAGGPCKILEDPLYQTLPYHIKDILRGLIKIQEERKNIDKKKIGLRFLDWLLNLGLSAIYYAVSNMLLLQDAATNDPDTTSP